MSFERALEIKGLLFEAWDLAKQVYGPAAAKFMNEPQPARLGLVNSPDSGMTPAELITRDGLKAFHPVAGYLRALKEPQTEPPSFRPYLTDEQESEAGDAAFLEVATGIFGSEEAVRAFMDNSTRGFGGFGVEQPSSPPQIIKEREDTFIDRMAIALNHLRP